MSLSTDYTANEGADNTQVYSGTLTFTPADNETFDLVFPTSGFIYNPAAGNLLMTVDMVSSTGHGHFFGSVVSGFTAEVLNLGGTGTPIALWDEGLVTQFMGSAVEYSPEPGSAASSFSVLLTASLLGGYRRSKRRCGKDGRRT